MQHNTINNTPTHIETINFLEQLRPGGPWVLTAITPDGSTETITANNGDQVRSFVGKYDGQRNLYYSLNPTKMPMTSKAAKTDIARIEYLHSDLDPKPDETTETAKARYGAALDEMTPKSTALIDSGNGVQGLFKLAEPIDLLKLPPPKMVIENGKRKLALSEPAQAVVDDVENRIKLLTETLGGTAGTQNIDRILRLPGTINLPNAKKRGEGRKQCLAKVISFNGATCRLQDFPAPAADDETDHEDQPTDQKKPISIDWAKVAEQAGWLKSVDDLPDGFSPKGRMIIACNGNLTHLSDDLIDAGLIAKPYYTWSHVSIALAAIFKAAKPPMTAERIAAALICKLECNRHITKIKDEKTKRRAVERLLKNSYEPKQSKGFGPVPPVDADGNPIVSDTDHVSRARRIRNLQCPHLLHYRDDFMDFEAGAYRVVADGSITADTWTFLDKAKASRMVGRGKDAVPEIVAFEPDRNSVGETLAALKAIAHLDPNTEMPCWLNGRDDLPTDALIAFPNGILDLRNDSFHPVDPNFFTIAALGFDYTAVVIQPAQWLKFLDEIFAGEDRDKQISMLQEAFGYLLTADVSQEKAFLLLGPRRSGKGTILGMLRKLLATTAVAGPSLKSLGNNFGLEPLTDKHLAIIDDLRVGKPSDQDILIENILKITGRGLFTIDRKHKTSWTGTLPTRLFLISNLMPKLGDDSSALAGRFITFETRASFYGREDPRLLQDKLAPELIGVFHWALEGLRRLRKRGCFLETTTSKAAQERLANLGSPARAFIAERCELVVSAHIDKRDWPAPGSVDAHLS